MSTYQHVADGRNSLEGGLDLGGGSVVPGVERVESASVRSNVNLTGEI